MTIISSKIDDARESAIKIQSLKERGAVNAWFYMESGNIKFDIFVSNNGSFINTDNRIVNPEKGTVDEVRLMIESKINRLIESENSSQSKLF